MHVRTKHLVIYKFKHLNPLVNVSKSRFLETCTTWTTIVNITKVNQKQQPKVRT